MARAVAYDPLRPQAFVPAPAIRWREVKSRFTLLELMIVIFVMLILVSIAVAEF